MKIFKKILMCALTGAMLLAGAVCTNAAEAADGGMCGPTASWTLDSSGTLTISGNGAVTSAPWRELDSEITSLVIGDGITDLGEYTSISTLKNVYISDLKQWLNIDFAFKEESGYSCSPMISAENMYINGVLAKDIVIPDGITEIKGTSFYGWDCLGSVTIPDSVKTIGWAAFAYCPRLGEVTFGNGLETIGNYAFEYTTNLLSVVIPDSVKTIGAGAFLECNSLEDLTIGSGVTSIGDYAFRVAGIKNLYIKDLTSYLNIDTKTPINMYTKYGQEESNNIYINGELATEIVIPDGVENIRDYAFYEWKTPKSITVPDSVKTIGNGAFSGCGSKSIKLGNGVEQINSSAFYDCRITSIEIPPSLKTVGQNAFEYCPNLKDVYITDLAAWLNINFGSDGYNDWYATPMYAAENMYINGALASNVTVPEGITEIKNLAFLGWDCMKNINIPESVTRIGDYAFGKSGLTKVIIPDSVTELGQYAFFDCESLTEASIGSGVTTIKGGTFYADYSLLRLAMSSSVTTVETGTFYQGNIMTVYYDGDKSDWRYISFNENNDSLKNAVVLYGAEPFKEITAYSGKCGENLTWEITSHGNMTVSGSGAMTDGELPWKDCFSNMLSYDYYPKCTITVKEGVTSLSEEFKACCYDYHVKCMYLPKSLVNINFLSNFSSDMEIYYSGTEEQWKAYEFSDTYRNNVHFNSLPPAPPLEVSVTHTATDNAVQFSVSVSDAERIDEIKDVKLYVAEYDENGILINIREGVNGSADGGSMVITADKPESDKFKFMLWDDNLYPFMKAVTDI